jgi:hypothetical protein
MTRLDFDPDASPVKPSLLFGSNAHDWAYSDIDFEGGATLGELQEEIRRVETQAFELYGPYRQHNLSDALIVVNRSPRGWESVVSDFGAFCKLTESSGHPNKLTRLEIAWSRTVSHTDEGTVE